MVVQLSRTVHVIRTVGARIRTNRHLAALEAVKRVAGASIFIVGLLNVRTCVFALFRLEQTE